MKNKKHIIVVGGGPGGYPAAIKAAQHGAEVTLVDRNGLGGTCLHRGCIPTKFLLKSAKDYDLYTSFARIHHDYAAPPDLASLMKKKKQIIQQLASGTASLLEKNGVRVIRGTASFLNSNTILIKESDERITPSAIIVATGSKVVRPPIPGINLPGVIDSDSILELDRIPKSLAVIGGGYIGLEFAQIFRMFGTDVSVLEMLPRLVATADSEASAAIQKILEAKGISITTLATVTEIIKSPSGLQLVYENKEKTNKIEVELALVAVGRAPQLDGLNIECTGIRPKKGAVIPVNGRMETTVPGIYAVGDVVGGLMLAHKASAEGECAAVNACGGSHSLSYNVIPSVMYTFPEMASVGLTEEEAQERYGKTIIGRFPFAANGRAVLSGTHTGFVKVVADKRTGCMVGASIIGPEAGHLIGEAALAIQMEATLEEIAETVHAHPTLSEAIREAALDAMGKAIHIPPNLTRVR